MGVILLSTDTNGNLWNISPVLAMVLSDNWLINHPLKVGMKVRFFLELDKIGSWCNGNIANSKFASCEFKSCTS